MYDALGTLKIPDIHLFTVFAIVELVYSKMAAPVNFPMFKGSLLAQILQGILQKENIISLFSDLFTPGKFSSDILLVALTSSTEETDDVKDMLCYYAVEIVFHRL